MSTMIEVKTSALIGPALDWAVAKAAEIRMFDCGRNWPGNYAVTEATRVEPAVIVGLDGRLTFEASLRAVAWSPSTDWAQGGPLIEKFKVELCPIICEDLRDGYGARIELGVYTEGSTPLQAACREIVRKAIGDVVQVPAELVQ